MTKTLTPIPERLAAVEEIPLLPGGHSAPPKGCDRPEGCDREIAAWVLGQKWTDRAPWESPVLAAFRRRLNDALPDDLRQKLKASMFDGIGTAGDGRDEDRAWMITDWSIRVVLPTWLELAGVEEAPKTLRALPEVTEGTFGEVRPLVRAIRDEAWERRRGVRERIREAVEAELKKRGIERPAADAAADAAAAAVADAVADAAAAAVADAVAVAAAAAAAVAVADAVAAAVAAAWRLRVYSAVYKKLRPIYEEKFKPTQEGLLDSALDLITRMSDLEPSA